MCRLRINLDIEFGNGGPIAFVVAAAHKHNLFDTLYDARFFARGHSDIGQRTRWNQGNGAGFVGHDGVDDEVDGVGIGKRGAWVRKLDAIDIHAGGAVDNLGNFYGAHERAIAAGVDRNLRMTGDFLDDQGIAGDLVQGLVAADGGNAQQIDVGIAHSQEQGYRVIVAGVAVQNNFSRHVSSLLLVGEDRHGFSVWHSFNSSVLTSCTLESSKSPCKRYKPSWKGIRPAMPSISDRLTQAQQDFNAVISTIPYDEDAVDTALTLRGLPVAFKDIVDIAGVPTTCGTNVDTGPVPTKNATVAQRLMDAGAIPVAKANLQEFSYGILGDASAYGRVINPRDPQVCGGGSSSGSAALVASGALELTVGSDSAGSVRVPAASQGVLGFKPTTGTIPLDGVFPFAPSFDCIGFFATSIELIEQALLATVNEEPTPAENVATMDISALTTKGERFAGLLSALQDSTFAAVERLDYSQLESTIATTAKLYAPMRLKEAYDVHQPYLDQRDKYQGVILERVLGGQDITQADYDAAAQQVQQLRTKALTLVDASPIILTPTLDAGPIRWDDITAENTADSAASLRRWTEPFNVLGWPAITVPLRTTETTGVGDAVQVIGNPGQDLTVLRVAREIQALL